MKSKTIKVPKTKTEVHPLIQKRWSALSFSEKIISEEQMEELFEAASWAASSYNEQPWRYVYAFRGTEGFDKLWNCLLPGNQLWTKNAAVLFVALKRNTFSSSGKPNPSAAHDLGMANAQLLLQAVHRDIYGHLIAGFEADKVTNLLELEEDIQPICMGALGYLDDADQLEGNYKVRELSPRKRHPVTEFTKRIWKK